jgi:antitoxin component YwqK of YwqJK toxin-antitoxin module
LHQKLNKMNLIRHLTQQYPSGEGYVFASRPNQIIIFRKLNAVFPYDFKFNNDIINIINEYAHQTITNEDRHDVVNPLYAWFQADKLQFIDAVDKLYPHKTIQTPYLKGSIVNFPNFDKNVISRNELHYFINIEQAFYYNLLIDCSGTLNNYSGPYKEWGIHGKLYKDCTYKNGKLDGLYKAWHWDGQPKIECTYKDGKKDGLYKEWNWSWNAQLKEECTYKDDKKDGLCKVWYDNGQLKVECTYKGGEKNGLYNEWCYDNGQLAIECTYKDGELNGLYNEWYSNGALEKKCTYKDDSPDGLCKTWGSYGRLKSVSVHKNKKPSYFVKQNHPEYQLWYDHAYKQNIMNGTCGFWETDGQLTNKCPYKNEEADDLCKELNKDNNLRKKHIAHAKNFMEYVLNGIDLILLLLTLLVLLLPN